MRPAKQRPGGNVEHRLFMRMGRGGLGVGGAVIALAVYFFAFDPLVAMSMSERAALRHDARVVPRVASADGTSLLVSGILGGIEDAWNNVLRNSGGLAEALDTASAIADDRLWRQGRYRIMPASFSHGGSGQPAHQPASVAANRLATWWDMLTNQNYMKLPELQKLELVNNFMNRTPLVRSLQHWGRESYWATPLEFLSTNGGDCKDYSIAKYFTLRALGVSDEKLRILYVKELVQHKEAHMVLVYYPDPEAEPLVLDNVIGIILPAMARTDLLPVFSFKGSDLWLAKEQGGRGHYASSSGSAGDWRNWQSRLRLALRVPPATYRHVGLVADSLL